MLRVGVSDLLSTAHEEMKRVGDLSLGSEEKIGDKAGHSQMEHVNYRFGLDDGVETLCLALNLWPGVATVNSCSGLHRGANGMEHYM